MTQQIDNVTWQVDLSELSNLNHRRHRGIRIFIATLVGALAAVLVIIAWLVVVSNPSGGVAYVPVTVLVVGLLLSLGAYGLRFWATPPISVAVLERGLRFGTANGRTDIIQWDEGGLDLELLDRSSDPRTPTTASYRIWVRGTTWDRRLPWRRVIPLTYVTRETFPVILDSARTAGAQVIVNRSFNPISMGSLTDNRATEYIIHASWASIRVPDNVSEL